MKVAQRELVWNGRERANIEELLPGEVRRVSIKWPQNMAFPFMSL